MTTAPPPTAREYDALRAIINATNSDGVPPTRARIAEMLGTSTHSISRPLVALVTKGYAKPAYDGGPWVAQRGLDGQPVRLVCRVEAAP